MPTPPGLPFAARAVRRCLAAGLLWLALGGAALAGGDCRAPAPVCAVRAQVFRIASFDPVGSAVLVDDGLLVTNRHIVADRSRARVFLPSGATIEAAVVATGYRGDLVLLRAEGLTGGKAPEIAAAKEGAAVYAVGVDLKTRRVRVYPPGRVLAAPAAGKTLARIHHNAPSFPGNSGGALVDAAGRLVGIVASGGDGLNEAIPAAQLAALRALSGPRHAARSREVGIAYRVCITRLERLGTRPGGAIADPANIAAPCADSGNRQLFDLAGQALAKAGRFAAATAMFERALEQDPNAFNARLGLVVTLQMAGRERAAVPHLEWLLDRLPADLRVLRLALRAGRLGGDAALARRALDLLRRHHPRLVPRAREFLDGARPPRPAAPP